MLMKFLNFDEMITPIIIKAIYWIAMVVVIISSVVLIFRSFFAGVLALIFGPLAVRMYAELMILLFGIHENLVKIRRNTEKM